MRASSPLYPLDATASSSAPSCTSTKAPTTSAFLPSMRRTPSCEWREWEVTLDSFSAVSGDLMGVDAAMDVDLDQFLLDDFLEPFAGPNATPDSPIFAADHDFLNEQEQDLHMLQAAGFDANCGSGSNGAELQSLMECKLEPQPPPTTTDSTHRHRKRKTAELHRLRAEKKVKRQEAHNAVIKSDEQAEKVYRRRYDILHGILEAWNTGVIEDLEEIADNVYDDDVTLFSPNYSEGLHGVEAVMSHWNLLLDAFPDGIMEEYIIQRDEGNSEKMKATWTFSGTQIYPIFGVQPLHRKVCISGKSCFTFKGDRIQQMELSWNNRETLLKLMGMQPDSVVLSASTASGPMILPGVVRS
ncbi:hypothetical protein L917_16417 [Phytophthora nicotianae]|uniref:SnoaL-like domain-containing protein n=3 Tax=Phytophthora nicotianae TaxID=4792 RepID=V9ECZ8_PHYNI|nr:hypothetical protein F443_17147 [Phytophthora nicotianae P1569]ETL83685.1 hypothetical protein L917_16417 [Phytophthora nicotianae]ETO65526.1 hypothetical protein F444_17189 [Phytophthora nicotianae P1976]KUF83588.1 hypothetical protein AM587_10007207 [Phytophthora nicotianae]ETM36879.1 hypothetical protein L914_16524 [Phytophthora nicotianae]